MTHRMEKEESESVAATLEAQQQWLFRQILQGQASADASQWIDGSQTFPVAERVRVYQAGYRLRLLECMQVEFPALHLYLGDDLFRMFALGYLQQMPSRHYSLYELGAYFADFLRDTRPSPAQANMDGQMARYLALPEQLAQLERAQAVSIRANGGDANVAALSALQLMTWPKLSLPETSQLVEVDFDLLGYLQQAERYFAHLDDDSKADLDKPSRPVVETQSLLVFRDGYRVNIARLQPWQAVVMKAAQASGKINWAALAAQCDIPEHELLVRLSLWLPEAVRSNQVHIV